MHTVTTDENTETIPMRDMKPGDYAVIKNSRRIVLRVLNDSESYPFIILDNGDSFNKGCANLVTPLKAGSLITIKVG